MNKFRVYGNIGNFTQVSNSVARNRNLSIGARHLYTLLLGYRWKKDFCFPGQETMAGMLGVSDRQVRTWLTELEAAKIIKRKRRGLGKTDLIFFEPIGLEDMPKKRSVHADRNAASGLDRNAASDKEEYSEGEEDEDEDREGGPRLNRTGEIEANTYSTGRLAGNEPYPIPQNIPPAPPSSSGSSDLSSGAINCGKPEVANLAPGAPGCPVAGSGVEDTIQGGKAPGQGQDGGGAMVNGGGSILKRMLEKSAADKVEGEKSRAEVTRKASGEITELYREYRSAFKIKFKVDDSVLPKWLGKERSLVKKLIEMYGFALTKSAMLLYINQWEGFARGREGMPDIGWLWIIRDTVFTSASSGKVPKARVDNRTFDQYQTEDGSPTKARGIIEQWAKRHTEKPNYRE